MCLNPVKCRRMVGIGVTEVPQELILFRAWRAIEDLTFILNEVWSHFKVMSRGVTRSILCLKSHAGCSSEDLLQDSKDETQRLIGCYCTNTDEN
jgi:hypothetical protein